MVDYLKLARTALALNLEPEAVEATAEVAPSPDSPKNAAGADSEKAADSPEASADWELDNTALSLKGHAVELWCEPTGGRVFIVADEVDAREAMARLGAQRGEIWTPVEIELVASVEDQVIRDEIACLKRQMKGSLSPHSIGKVFSGQSGTRRR